MKNNSQTKPRIVNYVTTEEMLKLRSAAKAAGLKTPSQIVGAWMRQHLTKG